MSSPLDVLFSCAFIIALLITVPLFVHHYDTVRAKVDPQPGVIQFRPEKARFLFRWYLYFAIFFAPILLTSWFLSKDTEGILIALASGTAIWWLSTTLAYPYYTIIVKENMLNGPTLWGWMWRREEIAVKELDTAKTLNNNIGKKIGVLIFYSMGGKKILSLGLNDAQVRQILDLADKAQSAQ